MKKIVCSIMCFILCFGLVGCGKSVDYEKIEKSLVDEGYYIDCNSNNIILTKKYDLFGERSLSYNEDSPSKLAFQDTYLLNNVLIDPISNEIISNETKVDSIPEKYLEKLKKISDKDIKDCDLKYDEVVAYMEYKMKNNPRSVKENTEASLSNEGEGESYSELISFEEYEIPLDTRDIIDYMKKASANAQTDWSIQFKECKTQDSTVLLNYVILLNGTYTGLDYQFLSENGEFKGAQLFDNNGKINTSSKDSDTYLFILMLIYAYNNMSDITKDDVKEIISQVELSKTSGIGTFKASYFAVKDNQFVLIPKK